MDDPMDDGFDQSEDWGQDDGNPVSRDYPRETAAQRMLTPEERDELFADHSGVQSARAVLREQDKKGRKKKPTFPNISYHQTILKA